MTNVYDVPEMSFVVVSAALMQSRQLDEIWDVLESDQYDQSDL